MWLFKIWEYKFKVQNKLWSQSYGKERTLPYNRPASRREYNIMDRKNNNVGMHTKCMGIWQPEDENIKWSVNYFAFRHDYNTNSPNATEHI